jgi:hypothetical protein
MACGASSPEEWGTYLTNLINVFERDRVLMILSANAAMVLLYCYGGRSLIL